MNYKMIFFDMDGVLIDVGHYKEVSNKVGVSTWRAIYELLGILNEDEKLKRKFEAGGFESYMEWTEEACRIFQKYNLTKDGFLNVVNNQKFMKGAKETITELKNKGLKTAVITGSFTDLAERVKNELGIDETVAHCDLQFDKNGKLKNWKLVPCDYDGKVTTFIKMAKGHGVEASECVYVGDEVNDISLFQKAGLSIAFNCKKELAKNSANVIIDGKDLRSILSAL